MKPVTDDPATRPSDRRRFEAKVTKKSGPVAPHMRTPCWEWTGAVDGRGYPRFWLRGNSVTAQRAALLVAGEVLHPRQQVANVCGRRLCVRRSHLAACTLEEAHALRYRGERPLGPGEICLIRRLIRDGEATAEYVAVAFGVTKELVVQIAESG